VLLAAAFGDAYALGWEHVWPPPRPKWRSGRALLKPVYRGGAACYSDDTEMALILARHLVEHGGVVQDVLAAELAEGARLGDSCRFYGSSTSFVLHLVREGRDWRKASREANSYGNGAAIRVPPVPMYYADSEAVERAAKLQAEVTHSHRLGIEGAVIVALAIEEAAAGTPLEEIPAELAKRGLAKVYQERLKAVSGLLDSSPFEVAAKLGTGAAAPESVPAALLCAARSRGSVMEAVTCAICLGGDTDSIASMAAAITAAGGRLDVSRELLEKIENYREIVEVSRRLVENRG